MSGFSSKQIWLIRDASLVCVFASLIFSVSCAWADSSDVSYHRDPLTGSVRFITGGRSPSVAYAGAALSDAETQARASLQSHANVLGITSLDDSFELQSSETDELGMKHLRFKRLFRGIEVFGAEAVVHLASDHSLRSINAPEVLIGLPDLNSALSREDADKYARGLLASSYPFTDLQLDSAKLMLFGRKLINKLVQDDFRLVWALKYSSDAEAVLQFVMIDALNGSLVHRENGIKALSREIYDCSFGNDTCYLSGYSDHYDYMFGRSEGQVAVGPNPIAGARLDSMGRRSLIIYGSEAVDELYLTIGQLSQYLQERFGRDGANGSGGIGSGGNISPSLTRVYAFVDWSLSDGAAYCPNAWFHPYGFMGFCHGGVERDIISHEYGHALSHYLLGGDGFTYQGESGAVDEGFSDVFAELYQSWLQGSADWLNSSDWTDRNLADPTLSDSGLGYMPDRLYSENYYCGSEDNQGVHHNMGVFSKASYLAVNGGSFNGCAVSGIGAEKYEQVLLRAVDLYLRGTSDFFETYQSMTEACLDLYRGDGTVCNELVKAFLAVEADQAGACSGLARVDPTIACLDASDYCPADEAKTFPGDCGCGAVDTDNDSSGISDCLYGTELKDRLNRLKSLVGKLKVPKNASARKNLKKAIADIKARLKQMKRIVRDGKSSIDTKRPVNLTKTASGVDAKVKAALKIESKSFPASKKAATKAVKDFLKLLV